MDNIKTWQERKGYGPNTTVGIKDVDDEITELRAALATRTAPAPDAHATAKRIEHLLNTGGAPAPLLTEAQIHGIQLSTKDCSYLDDCCRNEIFEALARPAAKVADAPAEPIILEEDHPEAARWYGMGYLDGTEQAASPLPQGTPAAEVRDAEDLALIKNEAWMRGRLKGLEEAAQVCEQHTERFTRDECDLAHAAAAIRALRSQPDQQQGDSNV